ncbi:peptidylprolyl isomerase [Roseivirga seohaensis]|uniref:peptidylprolyl isomerase n=1 Tax=Roseivirga seohaensis TaxID=1914963 RepID=UPI003BA9A24B
MAIINTLREKMGRLLVVVVGASILAFVLTDVLSSRSSILGSGKQEVGEISGESISQQEYANLVESIKQNYMAQYGINPNEFLMQTIRDQAWEQLIAQIAYTKRFDKAGIAVSGDERIDMVQGKNISPQVLQQFADPQTGELDRQFLNQVLVNSDLDPQSRLRWQLFENSLAENRRMTKYQNLILKTNYVTLAEAQQEYMEQEGGITLDYLYIPFLAVDDNQITEVTDADLQAYLNEHKDEYTVEESRSIDYISFPVIPSAADSAYYTEELNLLRTQLETGDNDSTLAVINTEQGIGFGTFDPSALPDDVVNNLSNLKKGDVIGPKLSNGIYTLFKLSDIVKSDAEFVRVSHILLRTEGMSATEKAQVKAKAEGILRQARNGADFAQLAIENSEDSSGPSGGDLGWYRKGGDAQGQWAEPFENAAFSVNREGVINRVVESDFGYHIMNVTGAPSNNRYKVAMILKELTPSDETIDVAYQKAGQFVLETDSYDEFVNNASANGYSVFSGNNINSNSSSIGRLQNARQIVTWLYGEASVGDVKDFDLGEEYVVAVYRAKVEAGTAKLTDSGVRSQIKLKVENAKKAKYITDKIASASGSLSDMAASFDAIAQVYTDTEVKLSSNSLPNVGVAPAAVGTAFALKNVGDRSKAITTDVGVVIMELKSKNAPAAITDYTTYVNQIQQRALNNAQLKMNQSIREKAEILDKRYKFY